MFSHRQRGRLFVVVVGSALLSAAPRGAEAQAWLPSAGEGTVSIQWQNVFSKDHFVPTTPVDIGHIDSHALVFDVTYGLTDKVAVDVSLPFIASKYDGPQPHPTALDDGAYHGALQDFRLAVRYNLHAGRFAVTPYIGSIVPSHNYEYYAHAAPGRRVAEMQVGAYVARLLDAAIPGAFVQARVGYGLMQQVADINHSRAMLDLELGDFVTERFRVFGIGSGQVTFGGIDIPLLGPNSLPMSLQPHHDRIDRTDFLNVGGGASFSIRDSVDVFGSIVTNVANRNGHATNRGIDVGISWTFKRAGAPSARDLARAAAATDRDAEARALVKCVCQRGNR
jgi:hypothetical protein